MKSINKDPVGAIEETKQEEHIPIPMVRIIWPEGLTVISGRYTSQWSGY